MGFLSGAGGESLARSNSPLARYSKTPDARSAIQHFEKVTKWRGRLKADRAGAKCLDFLERKGLQNILTESRLHHKTTENGIECVWQQDIW
jgi:hypothetical protein